MSTRMAGCFKRSAMVASIVFVAMGSAVPQAFADPMVATGGYNRELHTMEMMKMLDANGDHMVSGDEFTKYYGELFGTLDTNHDGAVDAKEWVGTKGESTISVATGGYTRELRTMAMMKSMDTDADHKVTKDEFIKFHETIFTTMNTKGDGMINAESWLRGTTGR